jgi:hypothetical protein
MVQVAHCLDSSNIKIMLFSRVHLRSSQDFHAGISGDIRLENTKL